MMRRSSSEQIATDIAAAKARTSPNEWIEAMRALPESIGAAIAAVLDKKMEAEIRKNAALMNDKELVEASYKDIKEKRHAHAAIYAEELLTRDRNSREGRELTALLELSRRHTSKAVEIYSTLLAEYPDNMQFHLQLAACLSAERKFEEALGHYQKVLVSNSDPKLLPIILNGIGFTSYACGDKKQAMTAFKKAAELVKTDFDALAALVSNLLQFNELSLAGKLTATMLKLKPESVSVRISAGDIAFRVGDFKEAIEHYSVALQNDKTQYDLYYRLGDAQLRADKAGEACGSYKAYLTVFPGSIEALNNLGVAYLRCGDAKSAEEQFRKAIELAPEHVSSLSNLGKLMIASGNLDEAKKLITKAIMLAPKNPISQELSHILEEEERKRKKRE
jgi:tetratricopeptide (TPR) repeat protein